MRANWSNPRDPEAIPIILLEGANMDLLTQFLYWNVSLYRLCSHVIVFQQPASMSISLLSVTDKSKTKMRAHTHTHKHLSSLTHLTLATLLPKCCADLWVRAIVSFDSSPSKCEDGTFHMYRAFYRAAKSHAQNLNLTQLKLSICRHTKCPHAARSHIHNQWCHRKKGPRVILS